jgi:hypothetical protein
MTENFREYMFTSNVTDFVCPLWIGPPRFWCNAPSVCVTVGSTSKQYCCNPGDVCWTTPSVCAGDGSTFTCSRYSYTWCCLKNQSVHTPSTPEIKSKQELVSLIDLQRNLHAAIRPSRRLLGLGQESTPKYKRKRTQRNIFVLTLRATVRQLLHLRPRSVNCASRTNPNTTNIGREF